MLTIKVLYFAQLKAALGGVGGESVQLKSGATMEDLVEEVIGRHPEADGFRGSLLLAHNQKWATASTVLSDGDEVALMPPVSGG
ncbi:MAG: molybdopterin converting factor subunit 1 [Candidatus Sumerlaeia bacterium]|nr:molybdopterin converting factor subunit 1 [Candidatus Sumerlaeia bacterium]